MSSLDEYSDDDICEVSPQWLRDLYEELKLLERSQTGDLHTSVVADGHPSPVQSKEPYCTRSQRILYIDQDGNGIAQAHRYLKPNGSLGGASGKPDPKLILHDGTLYGCL